MQTQKYAVNQHQISTFLAFVKDGQIAIPEVQRPFVWDSSKVRDLLDSLFKGYPVGYVITWQNPNIRLKDGKLSAGKKILIDGQQRITALQASLLGDWVINKEYEKVKIKIAFNPLQQTFEVQNPAILKDKNWIADVSEIFNHQSIIQAMNKYKEQNPSCDELRLEQSITDLLSIQHKQIGVIELAHDLDIETVTEIFIRINSQGAVLSQADFAMSKIAASERYEGPMLRKAIDYFCHLSMAPQFFEHIRDNDKEFSGSDYFKKLTWLKDERDDLYDPEYTDMLRVAFTSAFKRGKLSDLVSLLSGRNFETREYEDVIAEDTFSRMKESVMRFMHEDYFKKFVMIIRSAGFITPDMIRSQNAINFAYILYLKLREDNVKQHLIEKYVRRWFVFSVLTSRYGGSPESTIDYDIRQISLRSFEEYLNSIEEAELSDAFWESGLVQRLDTAVTSSPLFHVFLASLVKGSDRGFLSNDITVSELLLYKGDVHHIFPKNYLKKNQKSRWQYNQIANYVIMQQEINIAIGSKSPDTYFKELNEQCQGGKHKYGNINSLEGLIQNLESHCIPTTVFDMNVEHFDEFLKARRKLMAIKIKEYYHSL